MSCKTVAKMPNIAMQLHPWLSSSGKFGYCDSAGKLIISPQYDNANLFQNGFAVVCRNEKYGVINEKNKVIIPLNYAYAKIVSQAPFTLLITKKEYNAWWHFWQWKWWPQWNILSSSHSGPNLVTKVPKAKWQIRSLPRKKLLYNLCKMDNKDAWGVSQYWKKDWVPDRRIPSEIKITSTQKILSINGQAYLWETNAYLKPIKGNLFDIINDSTLLMKKGEDYYLSDEKSKRINKEVFTLKDGIHFKTSTGENIYISKEGNLGVNYPVIPQPIFENKEGVIFFSPNFSKPFPATIKDYQFQDEKLTAKTILQGAVTITDMPNKNYFAIIAGVGKVSGWSYFLLNKDGSWNTAMPAYRGPKQILTDGRITFESASIKGVLDTNLQFYQIPLVYIMPCSQNHYWYMGEDTSTKKFGVYDALKMRWQVQPKYSYLQDEIAPGIAIYTEVKIDSRGNQKEWFGLLNLQEDKEITPPVYDFIQTDGKVSRTIDNKRIIFYINPLTGFEYRSK